MGTDNRSAAAPLFFALLALNIAAFLFFAISTNGSELGGLLAIACISLLGTLIYFLPSLAAFHLQHPNAASIFILNLLLGWLLVPWVIALVWAYRKPEVAIASAPVVDAAELTRCPFCDEQIRVAARKCKHCGSTIENTAPVDVADFLAGHGAHIVNDKSA